jgi:inosine-uridine nucleoside N-ribohydrolase
MNRTFAHALTTVFVSILSFACLPSSSQQLIGTNTVAPRIRVIIDNDFGGDPDGLFQLTHLLLSPSVDTRAIIGSHLKPGENWTNPSPEQAQTAVNKAKEVIQALGFKKDIPVLAGSNTAMLSDSTPVKSEAVNFIIKEAQRTDTKLPLYVLCGASLTEIASALLTASEIAGKLTLVWIGGPEYPDLALPPPNYSNPEYNLNLDIGAARAVFNRTAVPIWQVPRNVYRQAILPYSQLLLKIKPQGKIGTYLTGVLENVMTRIQKYVNLGEVYILGDSPLVLLTALQSSFEADPSSSEYVIKTAPLINAQGDYAFNHQGRNIRVYTRIDTNLMFEDFFAKLELWNK